MSNVAKWSASASLDVSGFSSSTDRLIADTNRADKSLANLGKGGSGLSGLTSSLGSLQGVIAGLGIGSQIQSAFSRVTQAASAAESVGFLNDRLGTNIEWLTTLQTAYGEAGVNSEQFRRGVDRLNIFIGESNRGGAEAQGVFRQLGLDWRRIAGQSFEQNFNQIAEALSKIEDRSVRARIAQELFGRDGGQAMLRLTGNVGQLQSAMTDVRARGGFSTEEEHQALLNVDTALDRIGTSSERTWRRFTAAISPAVTMVAKLLEDIDGIVAFLQHGPQVAPTHAVRQFRGDQTGTLEEQEAGQEIAVRRALAEAEYSSSVLEASVRRLDLTGSDEDARRVLDLTNRTNAASESAIEAHRELLRIRGQIAEAAYDEFRAMVLADEATRDRERTTRARLVAEAATPFERLQDRLGTVMSSGLRPKQEAQVLGHIFSSIGNLGQAPLLGRIGADTSEAAQIMQASMNPQTDRLADIQAVLERMRAQDERSHDFAKENAEHLRALVSMFMS